MPRFGKIDTDQEGTDQSRKRRDRDRADVGKRYARFVERLTGDPGNCLNVCAAGDFGNDPAVKTVYVDLRRDDVGADDPLFRVHFDNGGGGFVAGTFKSEN